MPNINIPDTALHIINKLTENGYEAYIVGGCVRDSLMGKQPDDWDICTDALPDRICALFKHTIPTGIKHGTVTVLINSDRYEVTTYRIDGEYSDNRAPDSVEFTDKLVEDLKRRDFTINAMAYNPHMGLCDEFGGREDLKNGIIRCVGNPDIRFGEDALRILRAWRFECRLGFEIERETIASAKKHLSSLENISAERIRTELTKALCGSFVPHTLADDTFLCAVIPEWRNMHINQNNPHHIYDVARHTLTALATVIRSDDLILKLAVLLHDIGKPYCYTEDDNNVGHFYGHAKISADIADRLLLSLKFDNRTRKSVVELIFRHDIILNDSARVVKRWLYRLGEEQFFRLLQLKRADVSGQNPAFFDEKIDMINRIQSAAERIIADAQCFRLCDLAVNGNDLIALGYPRGKALGTALSALLDSVIADEAANERAALLEIAAKRLTELS